MKRSQEEEEKKVVKFIARFLGKSEAVNDINGPRRKQRRAESDWRKKNEKSPPWQMEKNHQFCVKRFLFSCAVAWTF